MFFIHCALADGFQDIKYNIYLIYVRIVLIVDKILIELVLLNFTKN
jgi:hypothetical protein